MGALLNNKIISRYLGFGLWALMAMSCAQNSGQAGGVQSLATAYTCSTSSPPTPPSPSTSGAVVIPVATENCAVLLTKKVTVGCCTNGPLPNSVYCYPKNEKSICYGVVYSCSGSDVSKATVANCSGAPSCTSGCLQDGDYCKASDNTCYGATTQDSGWRGPGFGGDQELDPRVIEWGRIDEVLQELERDRAIERGKDAPDSGYWEIQ